MRLRKNINLIAACQKNWGIAYRGTIPWYSPTDMQYFKHITSSVSDQSRINAVIMGRKTFDSIGKFLPNRQNYIITRQPQLLLGKDFYPSIESALISASVNPTVEKIFVIGGAEIYENVLTHYTKWLDTAYLTIVDTDTECDQFLNKDLFEKIFVLAETTTVAANTGEKYTLYFQKYYCASPEKQYLDLIRKICETGEQRIDRTNIGTRAIFGEKMEFDISEYLPVLTTKKLPWKTIVHELLWFISGKTNSKILVEKGIHIWEGNTTREFLDSRGLVELPVGDIGAGYGHQWRHFGAEYTDCYTNYTGKGVDQLANIITSIKTDPYSRRHILTGWNPAALSQMALPPCHSIVVQFYVRNCEFLDCQMYQRSADIALGVPFNIASYSILVYLIAHVTGLKPGKFIHILGDAHIYLNHIEPLQTQLGRVPFKFPRLVIKRHVSNIDDFIADDLEIVDYKCYPAIKMSMAI